MRRARGELEAEVLRRLWAADSPVALRELRDGFPADALPATTTLLTILARLEKKGLVHRSPSAGGSLYAATESEGARAASEMHGTLAAASDRESALVHFAGQLDEAELAVLRRALERA